MGTRQLVGPAACPEMKKALPLFPAPDVAMGERQQAICRLCAGEPSRPAAAYACRDAAKHVVDCPGAIGFDPSTVLMVDEGGRGRSTFILPDSDRKGVSS